MPAHNPDQVPGPGAGRRPRRLALSRALVLALLLPAAQARAEEVLLADLPFEQLLSTEVVTADKIARQISDAPSAVAIVTAQDIKTYGYRTLADILDSMRGLFMAHNRAYTYLSGRGYGSRGSFDDAGYTGRITLLIDGYGAQDNYSGQVNLGNDGLLDVELIERVEYIPGSGSSSYGNSAFLGVINVITKKGRDIDGTQVSAEVGSHGWQRERLTYGKQYQNGLDLMLSVSVLKNDGRTLAADIVGPGYDHAEDDRNRRYFIKAAYQGWTLETGWAKRRLPMSDMLLSDTNSFTTLKYDNHLGSDLRTSTNLYYGSYRFAEDDTSGTTTRQGGSWQGVDSKLVATRFDRHTIVVGIEYRDDFQQFANYGDATGIYYQVHADRRTASVYVYDDITLTDNLQLNLGGRRDSREHRGSVFSPRGALIYMPGNGTTLKLSTGQAHRHQTAYVEDALVNPLVERVTTSELVWEQMLAAKTRMIGSLYRYRVNNYYSGYNDLYDSNGNWIGAGGIYGLRTAKGAELELEHLWDNGVRLHVSYARQDTRDNNGDVPPNTPGNIAKFNLSAPLFGESLRAGLGVRYLGRRLDMTRGTQPGYLVGDLTLNGKWRNWRASFSVRNLGNASYNEVSGALIDAQGIYPADRRNYWLQLEHDFK